VGVDQFIVVGSQSGCMDYSGGQIELVKNDGPFGLLPGKWKLESTAGLRKSARECSIDSLPTNSTWDIAPTISVEGSHRPPRDQRPNLEFRLVDDDLVDATFLGRQQTGHASPPASGGDALEAPPTGVQTSTVTSVGAPLTPVSASATLRPAQRFTVPDGTWREGATLLYRFDLDDQGELPSLGAIEIDNGRRGDSDWIARIARAELTVFGPSVNSAEGRETARVMITSEYVPGALWWRARFGRVTSVRLRLLNVTHNRSGQPPDIDVKFWTSAPRGS
jgi:hypothetical protein